MTIWDVVAVLLIAFALFWGYRRGFLRSVTGWVGTVLAFFGAFRLRATVAEWIAPYIDGKAMVSGWTRKYLAHRYGADSFQTMADVGNWLQAHPLLSPQRDLIMTQMLTINDGSALDRLSDTLAIGGWSLLLLFFTGFVIFLVIGVIGRFIAKFIRRVSLFRIIDSFVGATVAGILIFVVLALLGKLLVLFTTPESLPHMWAQESFFMPLFDNLFYIFWHQLTGL